MRAGRNDGRRLGGEQWWGEIKDERNETLGRNDGRRLVMNNGGGR